MTQDERWIVRYNEVMEFLDIFAKEMLLLI